MSDRTARLLQFMTPGFLHGMGNALFTIQAQAQVRNAGPEIAAGCASARAALEVLRLVSSREGDDESTPVGPQLRTVIELMRTGMRDQGIAIDAAPGVFEASGRVPRRTFVQAIVGATERLLHALPTGCVGSVRVAWPEEHVLCIEFVTDAAQLPFDIDLTATEQHVRAVIEGTGLEVRPRAPGHGILLRLPSGEDPGV